MELQFKGWTKPGPLPTSAELDSKSVAPEDGETLDVLTGHYRVYQLRDGHRFSSDDVLIAWYGTSWAPSARTVLDLGSGLGSVGMAAAWRLQGAHFVTIEAQDQSVRLARKSASLNDLEARYEIRHGDFRDPSLFKSSDEKFDLVFGSPPYFPLGSGILSGHEQKIACRFEVRGSIANYCLTAAERLAPGGFFSCIFPMEPIHQFERVIEAAKAAGLSIVRRRPVVFREGATPLMCLFAMVRSQDLPEEFRDKTWVEPELIIRKKDGGVYPEYSAIRLSIGFPPL
jgi:tRNA1Val (adenine37-N6)-methyltransferase